MFITNPGCYYISLNHYHMLYSGADVYDRVSNFLESLYRDMDKGKCGENAIIVSHGLFCRLFLTRFYRWPVSNKYTIINLLDKAQDYFSYNYHKTNYMLL